MTKQQHIEHLQQEVATKQEQLTLQAKELAEQRQRVSTLEAKLAEPPPPQLVLEHEIVNATRAGVQIVLKDRMSAYNSPTSQAVDACLKRQGAEIEKVVDKTLRTLKTQRRKT